MSSSEDELELVDLDISNDQYYQTAPRKIVPKLTNQDKLIPKYGSSTIRHSLPAYDLWKPFFPTHLNESKYLNLHRPKLRHYKTGPQAKSRWGTYLPIPVKNLSRNIIRYNKDVRFRIIKAINAGMSREDIASKFLLIQNAKDLTAKHGQLYLFEYSEEHPPVLSQVGMASNVKTYVQPLDTSSTTSRDGTANLSASFLSHTSSAAGDDAIGKKEIGFDENVTKSIYFSSLKSGSKIQVIENNLYRAPIYKHQFEPTDFLVIRTRNSYYIRPVSDIFTVGQTIPLAQIPQPSETEVRKFRHDLSNIYAHKLFRESNSTPPSLRLEHLEQLFPDYDRSSLKRRLRQNGATNKDNVYYQGTSNYGMITQLELRKLLTPDQYCLYLSALSARQRLRELNYSESMILPSHDAEFEVEVLAAPWNTSKAVLNALAGRCFLDLRKHLIDPTGPRREGFSCVSWFKSPTEEEQAKILKADALKRAEERGPVKFVEKNPLLDQIKKEKLERLAIFRSEAQLLMETQHKVLQSSECISSSEDEADDSDNDDNSLEDSFHDQYQDLSRMVVAGQSVDEINREKEEEVRREMLSTFRPELSTNGISASRVSASSSQKISSTPTREVNGVNLTSVRNKILRITRTYDSEEGKIQRSEIVREPAIIALYVKKKGGSVNGSQKPNSQSTNNQSAQSRTSFSSTKGSSTKRQKARSNSISLGPNELCRAEGMVLTISKKVLENVRPIRRCRRES